MTAAEALSVFLSSVIAEAKWMRRRPFLSNCLTWKVLPTLEKVFGLDSGTSNPQPPQIMRPYPIRRW